MTKTLYCIFFSGDVFSLYDKGFKLEIHRDGSPEKTVKRPEKYSVTSHTARPKYNGDNNSKGKPKKAKQELEAFDISEYPLLKNMRIKNILSMHARGNREMLLFFLKKGNSSKLFATEELMDEWGVIHRRNISTKLKPLLDKGHIRKSDGKYCQNLTGN